ncbi:MAG: helicase HerA domain-containing protein [Candidatus Saccharimonadales bacterium]
MTEWGRPNGHVESEHLAILGPTGSGKTKFMTYILKRRAALRKSHIVLIATKPADSTIDALKWPVIRHWPPNYGQEQVIYWPVTKKPDENIEYQREHIKNMLNEIWGPDANIIVAFDEIAYIETELNLKTIVTRYWREARSLGITIVATTQRPRFVSRYMFSEPIWAVAFRPQDEDDALRVAEILGSRKKYKDILLEELDRYEFLLVHKPTREAVISKLPAK